MQSSVNNVLELQLIKQVQISDNSTILTFLIPTTGATIVITNAVFPEGIHTSAQHIAPYTTPELTVNNRLSTLPILQVQPETPRTQTATTNSNLFLTHRVKPIRRRKQKKQQDNTETGSDTSTTTDYLQQSLDIRSQPDIQTIFDQLSAFATTTAA